MCGYTYDNRNDKCQGTGDCGTCDLNDCNSGSTYRCDLVHNREAFFFKRIKVDCNSNGQLELTCSEDGVTKYAYHIVNRPDHLRHSYIASESRSE